MRLASFVRQLPRLPVLPTPTPTSADVARALSQLLQNQTAIMNDLAQIKNALPWVGAAPFEAAMDTAPSASLFASFASFNAQITQILSD
jgi:hypothetical protein